MKKVGFIDLQSKTADRLTGTIHVFTGRPGSYELEKSVEYAGDRAFPLDTTDVSEFTLSLPVELLNFRVLKLPFSDREKLQKVIPFELENLMMENAENVVFGATVLGTSGDNFDVLVTYIERGVLKEILANLSSVQIDPHVVTSLELQSGVREGTEGIAQRLMNQERLTPEERTAAVKNELLNPTINLRTGPFAYTRDTEKVRKKLKITAGLLIALALLINAYLIFGILTAKSEASSVREELRSVYTALFPADKRINDELYQMRSHMKEIKEKGDALIGVQPLQLLLDLSQKSPQGIAFNEIGLDRNLITIKGEAASMNDIDRVKTRLSEFLRDVSVSDIKPSAGGKTFFTIVAKGRK
jgi:type II secretory pathway component PulL